MRKTWKKIDIKTQSYQKSECIPVGCVPPATVVVMGGSGPDPSKFPLWVWAWIWSPSISPIGCWPGSDPPQFTRWLWAWTWSPSISALGVGLEGGSSWKGVSLVGGSPWGSPWQGVSLEGGLPGRGIYLAGGSPWQNPPPVNRMTDACENITLPQTSFAGGKNFASVTLP